MWFRGMKAYTALAVAVTCRKREQSAVPLRVGKALAAIAGEWSVSWRSYRRYLPGWDAWEAWVRWDEHIPRRQLSLAHWAAPIPKREANTAAVVVFMAAATGGPLKTGALEASG